MLSRFPLGALLPAILCAVVAGHPAPRPRLAEELPGTTWHMKWGAGDYTARFSADGRYSWSHQTDWLQGGWREEKNGDLWVREGDQLYRWSLHPTTDGGWAGTCCPMPTAYSPHPQGFPVVLRPWKAVEKCGGSCNRDCCGAACSRDSGCSCATEEP